MPTRKQTISNILARFQIIRRTLLREVAERLNTKLLSSLRKKTFTVRLRFAY